MQMFASDVDRDREHRRPMKDHSLAKEKKKKTLYNNVLIGCLVDIFIVDKQVARGECLFCIFHMR